MSPSPCILLERDSCVTINSETMLWDAVDSVPPQPRPCLRLDKRKLIFKHLRLAVARRQTTTAVSYVSLYQFSLNCNLVRSIPVLINVNLWQALLVFYLVFYLACTGHLRQSRRLVTHRMARLGSSKSDCLDGPLPRTPSRL